MPPTVILIRHAQALHNVADDFSPVQRHGRACSLTGGARDSELRDPGLSPLGFEQCQALRETLRTTLPGRFDVQLVLVSPMLRTLQTAVATLDWLMAAGVPVRAHAGWQETTDHPCDVGSAVAALAPAFPGVDFAHVDPVFPDKTSAAARLYAYARSALVTRAQTVLAELYARPEPAVVVVSHSAFLCKAVSGSMFGNADFRIFSFEEPAPAGSAAATPAHDDMPPLVYRLREWDETKQSRGGMGWSPVEVRTIGDELPA